ncbi:hypothetical protein [Lentzea albidocapillata]|uniref:Uncharacterized protein n=1 Tax=Lentzea albidocapillata TaxID=40571 RepID=A0A1W2FTD2_9PSEU|nr:hypothetical protein [Lentzea albidocapillata]SMD25227.1 hypothetical protein SAMN05660733_08064 [Lentzea albidocapillata]
MIALVERMLQPDFPVEEDAAAVDALTRSTGNPHVYSLIFRPAKGKENMTAEESSTRRWPTAPSNFDWGALVWGRGGSGGAAATNANALLGRSADELSRIPGLDTNSATAWRDFYQKAIVDGRGVANPANATNQARLDLLNDNIHSLGGR